MSSQDVSILGEDASLAGRISGQDLTILGGFEGELNLRGYLRLGPKARVKANVRAEVVEIEGEFQGEIRSTSLTFAPNAKAKGVFLSDKLGVREGALVEGAFNLAGEGDSRRPPRSEPAERPQALLPPAPAA
jgi:cytoskeletal protein CcmA (bactofilin family)